MNSLVEAILNATDDEIKVMFEEHCALMEKQGLEDIKFCLKGFDSSLQDVQRQILIIEKMHELNLTKDISGFEIFNENYAA